MVSTKHTQSLTDFRQKTTETLDRINRTGEAEILTVNGQARAVLLSPAVYDELARESELARDVAAIQLSRQQLANGKVLDLDTAFTLLRNELLAKKASRKVAR